MNWKIQDSLNNGVENSPAKQAQGPKAISKEGTPHNNWERDLQDWSVMVGAISATIVLLIFIGKTFG